MKTKKSGSDNILLIIFYILLTLIAAICIFPIIFAVIGSFTPESEVAIHGFTLFPKGVIHRNLSICISIAGRQVT